MATLPTANNATSDPAVPPYLPFSRFLQSLDALAGCMPSRIDRTLWSGESAYLATVLASAYAFLKLIDEQGAPSALLRRLAADTAKRPAILREVLERAYGDVLSAVSGATGVAEVEQALSHFRVSGATHRKAVSFLLQACRYAGIPQSSELTAKMRLSHAKAGAPVPHPPLATTMLTVTLQSGGEIALSGRFNPFALSADDRRFVYRLVDELAAYRDRREAAGPVIIDADEVPF